MIILIDLHRIMQYGDRGALPGTKDAHQASKERNPNKTTKLFPSRSFKLTMKFRILVNRQS